MRTAGRRRITAVGALALVALLLPGCGSSGSAASTASGAKPTSASTAPGPVGTKIPDTPAGSQLAWLLNASPDIPISAAAMQAHFDTAFLQKAGPSRLNQVLSQVGAGDRLRLVGLLPSAGQPANPAKVAGVVAVGAVEYTVTLSTDGGGLIDGLLIAPYVPVLPSWTTIDRALSGVAPQTSLLIARVSPSGVCTPVHQIASSAARPIGSMFKLFVLGALAQRIAAAQSTWTDELTVEDALKSLPDGTLQNSAQGTQVTVRQTAAQMISISDNTAADLLIHLIGQPALEAQVRSWSGNPALDNPFLTTRELFLLKGTDYPTLAKKYSSLTPAGREAFLASSVDPLPLLDTDGGWATPRFIDDVEWFASPDDMCRAFAGLQQLQKQPTLEPIGPILSTNRGDLSLNSTQWPTVWFKGGSEPGVLTLGYLATDAHGQSSVVVVMASNASAALNSSGITDMLSIAKSAFELVG